MKKIFSLIILFIVFINQSYAQNYNWITPNKTYLKLYIADDGMYNINYNDFTGAGISPGIIDPRTVKVIYKGSEIPVYFSGESDGVFNTNDYLEFYAIRNYGGPTISYDQNNVFVYSTNEYYNSFSDTNVYWIDWGGANGLRYSPYSYTSLSAFPTPYFNDNVHLEKDLFYSQGENISSSDYRFLNVEKFKGEGWFWKTIYNSQTLSDTFSIPQLYTATPQTASIKLFAYPTNRNTSTLNEHSLQVMINGNLITTLYVNDLNRFDTTITFSSSLLSNSSVNNVSVTYFYVVDPLTGIVSGLNVDFIDIQYPKLFKFANSAITTSPGGSDTTSSLFKISGFNIANPVNIYDVNNFLKITNYAVSFDTLKFTGKSNSKFEIANKNIIKKPVRIKQRSVPNLASTSNGADYLLIYNNLFSAQAEQLRAYRQSHDGFRSVKAEIEDIYDIFNYGVENPVAVRNFTKYVYDNWQLPKMSYICLLGRASLDPKKILSTSTYYKNYIPAYGYPPTDGYFANFNIGSFFYYDMVAIGRLPAYYPEEAQSMIDKIIAYESQTPDKWIKNYTYITGGGTITEQSQHQSKSNIEISSYIINPSLSGEPHKIYRSDISGVVTFNIKDSIKNDIDRGTAFVNFRGHAGSHDWEVAMNDPNTLNNGNKLPVILSLTCFTGENSLAYYRGFGERMQYLSGKGSIGFVGTTGWSYAQQGNDFGTHIINTIKYDTARRIGNLTKYAGKKMSIDSVSFNVRHTVNCYSLLGDPAAKLNIPVRPEFSITDQDYKISNDFPERGENVSLTIYPKNYGLYADSCKIRFLLKKDNQNYKTIDTVRRYFAQNDSVNFNFNLDSAGNYSIVITLDAGNYYPLEYKPNNVLTINLPVKNSSFVALRPEDNSVVSTDSVEFVCLNPLLSNTSNSIKVLVQFDTSSVFKSPLSRTFVTKNISGVSTKFKTNVPDAVNNRIYFWRTNCIINNDSTGWSKTRYFIYNNSLSNSTSKENTNGNKSFTSIYKINSAQYSQSDLNNVQFGSTGIELSKYTSTLFVRSLGNNAEEASYFSVGNKNIYIDGAQNAGLNMIKVKKLSGSIVEFKNLKMNTSASSDSVVTFLNTFDSTQYLMLLNASYFAGGTTLTTNAKTKLRQFGSIYCDSIGLLSYFHTWSLIGFLGANHSQVSEMFDPCCRPAPGCYACDHWTESISSMNVNFRYTSGTAVTVAGPAQSWMNFSWGQTLAPNCQIKFDVYGIDKNNNQTLLLSDVQTYNSTDLSAINAFQYPKLKFIAKINADTTVGLSSSVLNSLKINYVTPSEITYDINSLTFSSSYKVNDEFKFSYDNYNTGLFDIPGIITNVYKKSINASNLLLTDTSMIPLTVNSFRKQSFKFKIPYYRDSMNAIVEFKPAGQYNESYTYNNSLVFSMKNTTLNSPSLINVYADGKIIRGGEYVSSKPEIKIEIENSDNNNLSVLTDTNTVTLKLNNKQIPYYINGVANPVLKSLKNIKEKSDGNNSMTYYPEFQNGKNNLLVIYNDNAGNSDSLSLDLLVSDDLMIQDLYNYPNPMKNETNFMFNLTGSEVQGSFKLKIYTVSGKLIREIVIPASIGFNQIPWDGRDSDGDFVANGTYLYKLTAEGDIKTETETQKLVVLR